MSFNFVSSICGTWCDNTRPSGYREPLLYVVVWGDYVASVLSMHFGRTLVSSVPNSLKLPWPPTIHPAVICITILKAVYVDTKPVILRSGS